MAKKKPNKNECLNTDKWWDDISEIANDIVSDIEETLTKYVDNESLQLPSENEGGYINDSIGNRIERIYTAKTDMYSFDVYMDTTENKGLLLCAEPINIIMFVAEYVNKKIYNYE